MSIKTRPAAREVVAVYSVEEISMELVVKMSPSHPLGPVVVDCGKRVGVTTGQWRQWMLQLTKFLTQQVRFKECCFYGTNDATTDQLCF